MTICFAPASIAFSTSSFTADAGRSTTSPAAIRFAVLSSSSAIRQVMMSVHHRGTEAQRHRVKENNIVWLRRTMRTASPCTERSQRGLREYWPHGGTTLTLPLMPYVYLRYMFVPL